MAELKLNTQNIATVAVVIIAVIVGLGLYNRVSGLESRVATLDAQVQEISDIEAQLVKVREQMSGVRTDIAEIGRSRDQILRAICGILGRRPETCGVVPAPSP